jgi:hypothetical protein
MTGKKPIHPIEVTRLKRQRTFAASLSDDARNRYFRRLGLEIAARLRRCRSATGKRKIAVHTGERVYEYYPATGDILWGVHPSKEKIGTSAINYHRSGQPRILDENGRYLSAARVVHEAVHGPLEEDDIVYAINNDPKDLRILNLRVAEDGGRSKARKEKEEMDAQFEDPDFRKRAMEELNKIRSASKATA